MSQVATYDFRCNAEYTEATLRLMLKDVAKHWVFQRETSDTGYDHYQGRLSLVKKRKVGDLKSKWSTITAHGMPNYLEPTTNPEHLNGSFSYVMKNDTRTEGPWRDDDRKRKIPRQWREMRDTLYPWQQSVWDSENNYNNRTINLVYCPEGCSGKSSIAHVCRLYGSAIVVPPVNDAKELVAAVHSMCVARDEDPKLVFVDLPRAMDKTKLLGIYSAIEQIKNGYLYDLRYKFSSYDIDSPQVWVFTNIPPKFKYLSKDRWVMWNINEAKELVPWENNILPEITSE